MNDAPHSEQAEWSVVSQMLTRPDAIGEVVGAQLEPDDFFRLDCRQIFEGAVEAFYEADKASDVDAVTIGDRRRVQLSRAWQCGENEVTGKLTSYVQGFRFTDNVMKHVEVIRTHSTNRKLLSLAHSTIRAIGDAEKTPDEIGDMLTTEASAIVTGRLTRGEVLPWMEVGNQYVQYLQKLKKARESGVELAAYFGLPFVDSFSKGLAPTELMMVAGEPGVGKSAVTWKMAEGFAKRQLKKPKEQRIGTLVLSLEMGLIPSSARLATSQSGIEGGKLREGDLTNAELEAVARDWAATAELPMYFNFASNFRLSQMRALIVEAVRRHNVGLIVLDHFRMVDPDRRINNALQEDEAKARFLKENICKDLNVAVVCLAHTVKIKREGSDGRPTLNDLRGSYQVAAHCDMVGFIYRPIMYATENEIGDGVVKVTDAEMIWSKNRNGELGSSPFFFDPAWMKVRQQ